MQFNEFNRRLEGCHLDKETKYLLHHLFEVLAENSKQMDVMASLMTAFANTLQGITTLHEST